jgi:hypothetical protein
MKPINETRSTRSFCVSSRDARHIGLINAHYGCELIAVAHDAKADAPDEYTIRLASSASGIRDLRVTIHVDARVVEIEEAVTLNQIHFAAVEKAKRTA